jgi:hypothetical protein
MAPQNKSERLIQIVIRALNFHIGSLIETYKNQIYSCRVFFLGITPASELSESGVTPKRKYSTSTARRKSKNENIFFSTKKCTTYIHSFH